MRTFENYMIFIICVMGTIVLVTCDDDDHQQFYKEMLDLHNKAWAKHGAKPLVLNKKMCECPMAYLKGLSDGTLKRRSMDWCYHTYITENTEQVSAETIFNSFYDEGKDYDYKQEPKDSKAENFTQILWRSSEEVCFVFMYQNNTNYFAAYYFPRGNIKGDYVKNVGRLHKDRKITKYHQTFYKEMLDLHNTAREKHGAEPLILNDEISQEAVYYLELVIDGQADIQQTYWYYNLYISERPEKATAKKVFDYFYNEGNNYEYSQENEYKFANNFTRIVWKSTKEVGFALVYENKKSYFLAIYKPSGNMTGMYVENVGEPKNKNS